MIDIRVGNAHLVKSQPLHISHAIATQLQIYLFLDFVLRMYYVYFIMNLIFFFPYDRFDATSLKCKKKKKQTKYDSIGEKKILPGLGKGHPA